MGRQISFLRKYLDTKITFKLFLSCMSLYMGRQMILLKKYCFLYERLSYECEDIFAHEMDYHTIHKGVVYFMISFIVVFEE